MSLPSSRVASTLPTCVLSVVVCTPLDDAVATANSMLSPVTGARKRLAGMICLASPGADHESLHTATPGSSKYSSLMSTASPAFSSTVPESSREGCSVQLLTNCLPLTHKRTPSSDCV